MKYSVISRDEYVIIELVGSLSNETLVDIKNVLKDSLLSSKIGIIIDLSEIQFVCSAALGMLFKLFTDAQKHQKKFLLCCVKEEIRKLFLITGVNRHLPLYKTVDAAVEALTAE